MRKDAIFPRKSPDDKKHARNNNKLKKENIFMKKLNSNSVCKTAKIMALLLVAGTVLTASADVMKPQPYAEKDWRTSFFKQAMNDRAKLRAAGIVFLGDSITQGWTATWTKHHGMKTWKSLLKSHNMINLGVSNDRIEHVLWRVTDGKEIDGFTAKLIVLMIGTNNPEDPATIAKGIENLLKVLREKRPEAKILLLGVLPVSWRMAKSAQINELICKFADNQHIFYKDYSSLFLTPDGKKVCNLHDGLHPDETGYELLGKELVKEFDALLKK